MIRLTFYDSAGMAVAVQEASDFRISGGVIWNGLDRGLIAVYCNGAWKHRGKYYPSISFEGSCRLLFGITRDPSVTEPIGLFSIIGDTFRANGIAFARYVEAQDSWEGILRRISWSSFRVMSEGVIPAMVEESKMVVVNPWDPAHSESVPQNLPPRERDTRH
jgi:hypothetical protein